MARVLKRFNTEQEYENWKNSPDVRTPYTCYVRENGNVHYFDGDDNDFSITAVIKMTGWITVATRGMMPYIDKIYKNGVEMDFTYSSGEEEDNPEFTFAGRQTYYYRKWYGDTQYYLLDDYVIPYAFYAQNGCDLATLVDRGVTEEGGGHIYKTRFGKTKYAGRTDFDARGKSMDIRRFLFVEKGDVVKIVFNGHNLRYRPRQCLLGTGSYHSEVPKIGFLNKYASEVIIGDGFKSVDFAVIKMSKCKKIFLGKNVNKCVFMNDFPRGHDTHRIFATNKVNFSGTMPASRIITIN